MTKRPAGASAAAAKQVAAVPEAIAGGSETRTTTLRLAPAMHDRLREMAYTSRRSQHSLLLERPWTTFSGSTASRRYRHRLTD